MWLSSRRNENSGISGNQDLTVLTTLFFWSRSFLVSMAIMWATYLLNTLEPTQSSWFKINSSEYSFFFLEWWFNRMAIFLVSACSERNLRAGFISFALFS